MRSLVNRYISLPRSVLMLVSSQFLINLVNISFFLILNIYLRKLDYTDPQIASFTSYRFLGILMFAFPLGIFIKGRKVKKLFLAASVIVPVTSMIMLESVRTGNIPAVKISFLIWGIGLMLVQVCSLPFILRHVEKENLTEAISLNYATWSFAMVVSGIIIAILSRLHNISLLGFNITWDEYNILIFILFISLFALPIILKIEEGAPRSKRADFSQHFGMLKNEYDWYPIFKVVVPTLMISIGAGLTIPFVNLFFYSVFGIDSDQFSIIGSVTAFIVFITALIVPAVRRRWGYKVAILMTQALAVLLLVSLAMTELIASWSGAVYLAIFCYVFRQPLMNMAGPVTNELTMNFVGERNQELISALHSSIWSSSWFISAKIFQYLRSIELPYYRIFLITAALYALGTFLFSFVIREYEKKNLQDLQPELVVAGPEP